jgi:hypothetical protein
VSVKPSYSDQWFVAKPIVVKTHSLEINTQNGKFFILSWSFSLRPALPSLPSSPYDQCCPSLQSTLPPILPLALAPLALGAAAPVPHQRWEPPPLGSADGTCSLRLPPAPSEAPSKSRRPLHPWPAVPSQRRPLPASLVVPSLAAPSQCCRAFLASAPVLGCLLNCC